VAAVSEPKFTPGPYRYDPAGEVVLTDDEQMLLCTIRGWGYLTGNAGLKLPSEEATKILDANGHLFAAAPDLYEACELALEYHQGGHSKIGQSLRAALKKAKGEE
jgi:hypothetical protein